MELGHVESRTLVRSAKPLATVSTLSLISALFCVKGTSNVKDDGPFCLRSCPFVISCFFLLSLSIMVSVVLARTRGLAANAPLLFPVRSSRGLVLLKPGLEGPSSV